MSDAPNQPRTFADNVVAYAQAGWPCIIPVPPHDKYPPPVGFTGADGKDTDPLQLVTWAGDHAHHSIALRMPEGVIGIDVDDYVKGGKQKVGATTLAAAVERWGPLPPTWTSTARGPGQPSRIYFYRVPAQRYATKVGLDIEVIQRHHRYAVVWPSPHSDLGEGAHYAWYDPTGQPVTAPPSPFHLPELPQTWVAGLAEGATEAGPAAADPYSGQQLLDQLLDDWRPECAEITNARLLAIAEISKSDGGSRHDTAIARTHHLIQLAAGGHTGAARAVAEIREIWSQLTAGEDREDELERMLHTSARKAVSVVGAHQVTRDPCLMVGGFEIPVYAPIDPSAPNAMTDAAQPAPRPPVWLNVREHIGAHSFDPVAGLDQPLAEAVLERVSPAMRHAADANLWLLREPDRWGAHKDLADSAVSIVAPLMPYGDPTAEKGSEAADRASRRARLMTNAGARAIAGKIRAAVGGGLHPSCVNLGRLDSEPDVLWAGGNPIDLRASSEQLVLAPIDPSMPHLHSCEYMPERVPTPLWNAFLEAMWPDPALRAWSLRVLSVALTGYADRVLPILIGETGRGKTQVITLLMDLLGTYAHAADSRLLSAAGEKAHASIVYALKGRRLSFIDEGPREGRWAQERLKQLTGGGELTANQMHANPITFRPTHTLVMTTNDEPILTDPALRNRTRLIPCEGDPEAISDARRAIGPLGGSTWRREAPGVLFSMILEAAGYLGNPHTAGMAAAPAGIRFLAEDIAAEQDPIAIWLTEETEQFDPGTPSRELYQAFVASCRRSGMRADSIPTETKWGRSLVRFGFPSEHTRSGKVRKLRLRGGGFFPGMIPPAAPSDQEPIPECDGLPRIGDGLVTGSKPNPSQAFPQVSPPISVDGDGCDGFTDPLSHVHAQAQARMSANGELAVNPSPIRQGDEAKLPPDLGKQPDPSGSDDPSQAQLPLFDGKTATSELDEEQPGKPAKPKKPRTAEATAKAAAAKAERLALAIATASGPYIGLPAIVTRDPEALPLRVSTEGAEQLLNTILDEVTIDVEHTGYPVGHADYALRTIQLGNDTFAVVFDAEDPAQAAAAARVANAAKVLHAHSATADLVPMADAGLMDIEDGWARMFDTVTPAKLADPKLTDSHPDLKKLSAAVLGDGACSPKADEQRAALFKAGKWLTETKATTPITRSGWAQVDPGCATMIRYAAADVLDDAAIAKHLPLPEPEVLERERLAQTMTARVAYHGLRIDPERVEQLRSEQQADLADASRRLREFGIENPGSDAQVAAAVERFGVRLPRTATGKPSVAKGALNPFEDVDGALGALVRARLDYQVAENRLGLFLEPYHQLVTRGDGRARPTVYTLEAKTGRMSCVRPNLQQVPRAGGFRSCITADPGYVLISADFAQVELRVAAALSQDQNLIAILDDPSRDIHREIAQIVWGPTAGKAERYQAKRKVFGRIYGSGINGLVTADPPVSEAIARSIVSAMDHMTPGLTHWSKQVADGVDSGRTQFKTHSGRIVHMPAGRGYAAGNYCIQGEARELLIDGLMRWQRTRWGNSILFPVHDELVVMVPEDDAEEATATLEEVMANELAGVRILAEASQPAFAWQDSE